MLEQAIAGVATVAITDADYTLTASNGVSDQARNAALKITGTLTATRAVIIPNAGKGYTVLNSTTGAQSITVKTSGGTGVTIANGYACDVICDGAGATTQRTPFYNPTTNTVSGAVATSGSAFTGSSSFAGAVSFAVNPTVTGNALWHAGNFNPASYAPALGYTAVQQGTGVGQLSNAVKVGWSGSRLKVTVDSSDLGNVAFDSNVSTAVAAYLPKTGGTISGSLTVAGVSGLQGITGTTCTLNNVLTCLSPNGATLGRAIIDSTNTFGAWGWNGGGGYVQLNVGGSALGINVFVSDIRRKQDVAPALDEVLPLIRRLDFIDFRYKPVEAPSETVMPLQRGGISAQQIQPIRPEWVTEMDDGTLMPNVLLLLTNALKGLQELDAKVDALTAEVVALRG